MKCNLLDTQSEPGRLGRHDQEEVGAATLAIPTRVCEALPFNERVLVVHVVLGIRRQPGFWCLNTLPFRWRDGEGRWAHLLLLHRHAWGRTRTCGTIGTRSGLSQMAWKGLVGVARVRNTAVVAMLGVPLLAWLSAWLSAR